MDPFVAMLLYTTASGSCILVGGFIARVERIRPRWLEQELRHTIIAFGGGILIAAIAFVLVPVNRGLSGIGLRRWEPCSDSAWPWLPISS